MSEYSLYDLSLPIQSPDRRPLTPAMMGFPATYNEEQDEKWGDGKEGCEVASYVTEPCPVSRAVVLALLADENKKKSGEKEKSEERTKKQKRVDRLEKEKRYELAMMITSQIRSNNAVKVSLAKAEVELILDRTGEMYGTVPYGCIYKALSSPVVAAEPDPDETEA